MKFCCFPRDLVLDMCRRFLHLARKEEVIRRPKAFPSYNTVI
jgi:hypothetical protein